MTIKKIKDSYNKFKMKFSYIASQDIKLNVPKYNDEYKIDDKRISRESQIPHTFN